MKLHRGCAHQPELGNMTPCAICVAAEQRGYERGVKALRDALIKDATLNERWITPHATELLDAESGDAE